MTHFIQENNQLTVTFQFVDFKQALIFINKVGDVAESQNHHPEIINVYNKVTFKLCTHDAGNIITEKDYLLAYEIEKIYSLHFSPERAI